VVFLVLKNRLRTFARMYSVVLTRSFQRKSSWAWLNGISALSVPARTAAADAGSCACAEAMIVVKKRGNEE
jgi:hypothetical protein